jgi:rhodanese-related sulfurtransferase
MSTPIPRISREELLAKVNAREPGFRLVEALPTKYYAEAHLPRALNLPLDEVEDLAPTLLPDKAAPVVTYCASAPCENSGLAAEHLVRLGYQNVREYYEGKEDWIGAGLPVERGAAPVTR